MQQDFLKGTIISSNPQDITIELEDGQKIQWPLHHLTGKNLSIGEGIYFALYSTEQFYEEKQRIAKELLNEILHLHPSPIISEI